jgi:large subunit ribosomal protein L6
MGIKIDVEMSIPEGVSVEVEKSVVRVKGEKGEIQRDFFKPGIKIEKKDNNVLILADTKKTTKREKALINTFRAHINNMFKGVKHGYITKLKICSGHFPMSVSVQGSGIVIKNFLGEKVPIKSKILENVCVKVEGDVMVVSGYDKEKVNQTAANLEKATRISKRDRRIFQDGIFIFERE